MSYRLPYGTSSQLTLELADGVVVADCTSPHGRPLASPGEAVQAALGGPLGFPPLSQAVVPGDGVVLALDKAVPQAGAVVQGVIRYLVDTGTPAERISVLVPAGEEEVAQGIASVAAKVVLHDPDDRGQLRYLAATPKGQPVYLNSTLVDADVVVAVGCLRGAQALGYHGVHGGLYPTFSDTKTLQRYRNPHLVEVGSQTWTRAQQEVESVDWLSGHPFTVQVVPGGGDDVLGVVAGHVDTVATAGRAAWEAAWTYRVPRRASLVIAGVTGPHSQQNWDNLSRALATAVAVVEPEGAIALCTDLEPAASPAIECLAAADEPSLAVREIRKLRPPDTLPALELAQVLGDARVYLLSRLAESFVEDLGMAHVEQAADVARLASRHPSCLLIAHAQHAVVQLAVD